MLPTLLAIGAVLAGGIPDGRAAEDIEYISEHLPEGAMNYRYATLPLWGPALAERWQYVAQGSYARSRTGGLGLAGPMGSIAATKRLTSNWTATGFGFYDRMRFSGSNEERPLNVRFANEVPLSLPAAARFDRLGGAATDFGVGLALGHEIESGWWSDWRFTFGASVQQLRLAGYATRCRLLSGPSAGATGLVDYSGNYTFVSALLGLSRRYERGDWALTPHVLFAMPFPRRGVKGRISGDSFDIRGDTADTGAGKHYGDPMVAFGLDVEYRPWRAGFDLGALLSQPLLEPGMHKGIDSSLLMSVSFRF